MDFKSRPSATALEAESSDWIWFGCGGTKASVFFRNTRRTKMSAGAVLRRLGRTRGRKRRERETEGARASEAGAGEQRTTPTSTEEGRRGETTPTDGGGGMEREGGRLGGLKMDAGESALRGHGDRFRRETKKKLE